MILIAAYALALMAAPPQPAVFHASTPAGYDVLLLKPTNAEVSLLGLVECPELEGAQHVSEGTNARVISADGTPLTHFPHNFSFRITASLRKTVLSTPSGEVTSNDSPQDFLLKLKFGLKVFNGLQVREIQPESVEMIGVPADLPYDERVYRVNFSIVNVPVTDRMVLEVLSPENDRLTRFHFDLL
ncbi:MAG: hypothetical protein DMG65_24570 [Candidatus Angelobacter sp. Gp1-AA117]|nr:MAG: hypothetical protein DMG65_24570 [Candidatus Angelobacter sp. Gp1-AA117]